MKKNNPALELSSVLVYLLKWTLMALPLALITGSVVALFLWLLDEATHMRKQYPWLLFLLPAAGVLIYFSYKLYGKNAIRGNDLVIDEIHQPKKGIPLRMAPLVLLSTIITHLFGGSAGREGTAVQIGGSIANGLAGKLALMADDKKILLMMGVAAGFGAVFGTPLTGAVFALEVLALGQIRYTALLPCFMTSVFADITCTRWGIRHAVYHVKDIPEVASVWGMHVDMLLLLKVIAGGVLFGLLSRLFVFTSHGIKKMVQQYVQKQWLVPVLGGCILISLTYILGSRDYLGLGVGEPGQEGVSLYSCFKEGDAGYFSWFWKLLFTAVTLATGFKGGEVTPLFFMGAAMGNTLAGIFGVPVDLMAGLGFIAVFAGATNTPLACVLMGVELFGSGPVLLYAVACFTAYYFSGHEGIYPAQRICVRKTKHFSSE